MSDTPFFEFDFSGEVGRKIFKDRINVIDFATDQKEAYGWLARSGADQTTQYLINQYYNSLEHTIHVARDPTDPNGLADRLTHQFFEIYINGRLPLTESADYQFVQQVRQSRGDVAAAATLSYICNRMTQLKLHDKDIWVGLLLAFNREEGIGKHSVAAAKGSFERLNSKMNGIIERNLLAEHSRLSTFDHEIQNQAKKFQTLIRWQARGYERQIKKSKDQISARVEELSTVKSTYEELMKLRAPVDYWTSKAKQHREQAKSYKEVGLRHGWKVAAGLTAILCVIGGIGFFSATPDKPSSAYLFLITIGLVITTMAFWATRIIVRLYMSEHHLSIDADERATMALTYLALIERGAVDEKDRALILTPLFRPSSDGIVKDDAAPDLSPAALLSKALNK